MARIPESEIERLKAEVSLERLAESRGVVLKRHGADLLGLCPFHDDREPSLVISPAKNLWHCLGACQAGGTVIDWVMRAEGVSFRHAVELLREGIPALAADSGSQPAPAIPAKRGTVCKLGAPVAVVIQSTSAAGKSSLMDAVLALLPEEDRVKYSAMTGQSLFYLGETHMKHKVLAIVEEEGAARASYASKLLQSEGELTIASTGKDPQTGNLITQSYRVEGPVMLFLTTTAVEIDEELLNRCLVLSVDEGREQTRAIRRRQRLKRTLEGLLARQEREHLLALHRNVQRLLRPLAVVNPYAPSLSFLDE